MSCTQDAVEKLQAELDAARAEVAQLTTENNFLNGGAVADKQEIDSLLTLNEQLTAALTECCAALYGARELTGNIGNIGHAIELADAALRGQPAPGAGAGVERCKRRNS